MVDTNILVSALVPQRGEQHLAAIALAEIESPYVVCEAVLVETCWVLSASYGADNNRIATLLTGVLSSGQLTTWDPRLVERTLTLLAERPALGIVDCLLCARSLEGDTVLTFDRRLARTIQES